MLANICFNLYDFDSGLQYLKTAVGLNKLYAVYWYNMGRDNQAQEDFNMAILAFEHYFIALPENIAVLKEISDCNVNLGNLETACQSYEYFKKLLEK